MTNKDKVDIIARQFKNAVAQKYNIIEMKLFGSLARGDYSKTSDIDIMIKLPKVDRTIEEDLFDIAYDFELKHNCIIDVIVVSQDANMNIPLYQNIEKEGIAI